MTQWKIPFQELEFGERIGKGNFGEVYKGTYLGTDVAIKRLFFVDDDFMQKYIEREMDTLTQLNHPNIVQLMGLCIGMDDLYIITEFVKGGNLHSKLEDKSLDMPWKLRVSVLRDVALAMNYLHAKDKIHRDLKSHNLLVTEDWKVKVCDFGLARSSPDDQEKKGGLTIVGTNEWMAPEVAMGETYDSSADVFSYAMVIYEMLTRTDPPARKLKDCYAFKPEDFKNKIPPETPPKLWELLCDCAATTPADRPDFKSIVTRVREIYDALGDAPETPGSAEPKKEKPKSGELPSKSPKPDATETKKSPKVETSEKKPARKTRKTKKESKKETEKKSSHKENGKKTTKKEPTKKTTKKEPTKKASEKKKEKKPVAKKTTKK